MPRPKDPERYDVMYHDLAIMMQVQEPEIRIETTGANANYIRHNFYGFIKAWEHILTSVERQKWRPEEEIKRMKEKALLMYESTRAYLVVVDPIFKDYEDQPMKDWPKATVRFILRDMDPRHNDVRAQVNAQLDTSNAMERLAESMELARSAEKRISGVGFNKPTQQPKDWRGTPIEHLMHSDEPMKVDPTLSEEEVEKLSKAFYQSEEEPVDLDDLAQPKPILPPDMTPSDLPQQTLPANPPAPETGPITPSNQADPPAPKNYMAEALAAAEKLRETELKESEKSS